MLVIAESWRGLEKYEIREYKASTKLSLRQQDMGEAQESWQYVLKMLLIRMLGKL